MVQPRKRPNDEPKKPYYDDIDKAALRLMRKLRVDWTSKEDSFLLLCKVAGAFLCQNQRSPMVQYTWVRDLLHKQFEESANKTSRACQRRLNYMLKNETTTENVGLFLAEVKQDEDILSRFSPPDPPLPKEANERRLKEHFEPLVNILLEKYKSGKRQEDSIEIPDTIEGIKAQFALVHPQQGNLTSFEDPKNTSEVKKSVVNSLITSSLCAVSDKSSWAYQLFKIYQQYPDSLLRDVMDRLRADKMVSLKKNFNKSRLKQTTKSYLPLSSAPYQLSVSFSHRLLSKYHYDVFHQSWIFLRRLLQGHVDEKQVEVDINNEGGFAACVVGLMATDRIRFNTSVPEQLIVLDPSLAEQDNQYVQLLQRYKDLLKSSGSNEDASDVEVANQGKSSDFNSYNESSIFGILQRQMCLITLSLQLWRDKLR